MMQNLDVLQIVDQLCEKLQNTEFGDYDSEDDLLLDLAVIVTEFINTEMGEFGSVWVSGRDKGKIRSVWAYGTDFWPDMTIEARDLPTIAITVKLAPRGEDLADVLVSAVGSALFYSVQYSYAIAFVLDRTEGDERQHWFDGEIEDRLWANHHISLVIVR